MVFPFLFALPALFGGLLAKGAAVAGAIGTATGIAKGVTDVVTGANNAKAAELRAQQEHEALMEMRRNRGRFGMG